MRNVLEFSASRMECALVVAEFIIERTALRARNIFSHQICAAVCVGLGTETFMAIAITDQKNIMIIAHIEVDSKD